MAKRIISVVSDLSFRSTFNPRLTFNKIQVMEGGYGDDPRDPGGATNHGIILATMQKGVSLGLLAPKYPVTHKVTKADVFNMTLEEAYTMYLAIFVEPAGVSKLCHAVAELWLELMWGSGFQYQWFYSSGEIHDPKDIWRARPATTRKQLAFNIDIFNRLSLSRYNTFKTARGPKGILYPYFPGWFVRVLAMFTSNITEEFVFYSNKFSTTPLLNPEPWKD